MVWWETGAEKVRIAVEIAMVADEFARVWSSA
jgi:hypothetical protein